MIKRAHTNRKLTAELERLKQTFDLGHGLKVKWIPGFVRHVNGRRILGEVLNETIFVYAEAEVEAIKILRHEVLENALNEKFVFPYKTLINALLTAIEEQNYAQKEKLVKKMAEIMWGEKNREGVKK